MVNRKSPKNANQFEADLSWDGEEPLIPGRQYRIKFGSQQTTAVVTAIKYRLDHDTGAYLATRTLGANETGRVYLYTDEPLLIANQDNENSSHFLVTDLQTGATLGTGTIDFILRRATNIEWQALTVDKISRSIQKKQTPKCIWFTGLSGSGKSTIADLVEKQLYQNNRHTYLLDGDNVRHGLCRDLGFTDVDRVENIRRISEVARLMVDAGLIVLVSFISPFRSERLMARELFAADEFIEVFIDTPLDECERRDVKGLYAKARSGVLKNFTGIDSPYEPPKSPEIHIQTAQLTPEEAVMVILNHLQN